MLEKIYLIAQIVGEVVFIILGVGLCVCCGAMMIVMNKELTSITYQIEKIENYLWKQKGV